MITKITFWLLLSLSVVAADVASYIPQLTNNPIQGRVTTSTFVLDKPQCVFGSNPANNVWLVVARSTATVSTSMLQNPITYSDFSARKTDYYHTFNRSETFYSCSNTPDYIQIGSDSVCTDTYCNSPLPKGTYKVKFLVFNSTNALVNQTNWSGFITLREGKDPASIDTWPGRRSGGMIVITSILSVLLAAVFFSLVGTFIVGSKNLSCCRQQTESKDKFIPQDIDLKNYKTHHVPAENVLYDQPLA